MTDIAVPVNELEKYRERVYKPTSKQDILYMLGNAVKVVMYNEIANYKTLEELLDPYQAVVILYPNNGEDVGHWTTLYKMSGFGTPLQYFDSYGCFIDSKIEEYNEIEDRDIHHAQKIEPSLIELIINSPYANNTHYNEFAFQSTSHDTATCGLWVVVRLKDKHYNEYEFEKIWQDLPISRGYEPDLVLAAYICQKYPEM